MIRISGVNEPTRLFHKNFFKERAMEEGIRDIQLVNGPVELYYKSQKNPNGGRLDHKTEKIGRAHV